MPSLLLLRNPRALELLRHEIDTIVGHEKEITRAHIQRMSYLHNVLKESKKLNITHECAFTKTTHSTPIVPSSPNQHPLLQEDNYSPRRWWSGWAVTTTNPRRNARCVFRIPHATSQGPVWP